MASCRKWFYSFSMDRQGRESGPVVVFYTVSKKETGFTASAPSNIGLFLFPEAALEEAGEGFAVTGLISSFNEMPDGMHCAFGAGTYVFLIN